MKTSFTSSICLIRIFLLTKREEYIIDDPLVVEELTQLIRRQVLQKRKPNRKYERRTKQGAYLKISINTLT